MKRKSIVVLLVISLCVFSFVHGQTKQKEMATNRTDLGASVQLYPAGIIPTINIEPYVSENASLLFRLGGNFTDRQDFSDENDKETGSGFGGTFGYRKHFPFQKGKFIAGLNMDIWNMWIDWEDTLGGTQPISGTTYTFVLQPWLEAGYFLPVKNSSSQIGITAGFGREINAITNGDNVAQDWIASLSIQYQFTLKK